MDNIISFDRFFVKIPQIPLKVYHFATMLQEVKKFLRV